MIPRAQLVAERRVVNAIAPGALPPLSLVVIETEPAEARMRRMWSAGKSIPLIAASTGFEPLEIRAACAGLPRPTIRVELASGCSRVARHSFLSIPSAGLPSL